MLKNKYLVMGGAGVGVLILAAVGFFVWHGLHKPRLASLGSAAASVNGSAQPSNNVIPLTQTGPAPSDPGGLSVSSSNPSNSIGQLDGSQRKSTSGAGQGSGSSSGPGSNSSSAPAIDPSTFGQYEKYKSASTALFGDAQAGTGTELTAGHKAAVIYRGWLTNGKVFDESKTGTDGKLQPFVFAMGDHQVIPGWEQGLNGMKVGGTRLVIVPPAVGYGSAGQGSIPPDSVLVFEVQLLQVQ